MFLLRFAFSNHRSFRDEHDLSLVQPRLKTARPQDASWLEYTNRVAAIYGPNASGKSSVLEAMALMRDIIGNSAGAWSETTPSTPSRSDHKIHINRTHHNNAGAVPGCQHRMR